MALSNWFNSNIVIDMNEFKEIERNIDEYELDDLFIFKVYKNHVQIELSEDLDIAPQLREKSTISFEQESNSEIIMNGNIVFIEPGSKSSEVVYLVYNWFKKILILGICGIDDYCHNCGVMSIGKKIQDVYMGLLGIKTINIVEKDKDQKLYELIKSMTFYNQGGRKYPNFLAAESIQTIDEYNDNNE